jgi:hypothetical protein
MGISTKKSSSKVTPVYEKEIKAASGNLTNTYNQQAPRINDIANNLSDMLPEMQGRYMDGNRGVNAAQDYNVDVLGGKYLNQGNPYLDRMVEQTTGNVQNRLGASLNKMGLGPAGTSYQGLQSSNIGKAELDMRYGDYSSERDRMANAAGQSAGLANAETAGVLPMLATAELGAGLPMNAASQYASGIGGLLGDYTNTEKRETPSLASQIGSGLKIGSSLLGGFGGLMGGGMGGGGMLSSLGGPTALGMGSKSLGSLQSTFKNAGGF